MEEPGLDLHEWQTRWDCCRRWPRSRLRTQSPSWTVCSRRCCRKGAFLEADGEAKKLFTAAREASRSYEAGTATAGDLAHAINCCRELYELLTAEMLDPPQRAGGGGRSA